MRKKNLLWISLLIPLLLSLATMFPMVVPGIAQVNTHDAQAMWVDLNVTEPVPNCNNFTVDIYVNVSTAGMNPGATGLYAWEFMLFWENDKLNCTDATDHLPDPTWDDPNSIVVGTGVNQTYNATHGMYWRAIIAMPVQEPFPIPFVGDMSICTLTFHVIYQQAEPYDALLHLGGGYGIHLVMGDDTAEGFNFTAYDDTVPVITEFPVASIIPLFMVGTLVAIILRKRRNPFVAK